MPILRKLRRPSFEEINKVVPLCLAEKTHLNKESESIHVKLLQDVSSNLNEIELLICAVTELFTFINDRAGDMENLVSWTRTLNAYTVESPDQVGMLSDLFDEELFLYHLKQYQTDSSTDQIQTLWQRAYKLSQTLE